MKKYICSYEWGYIESDTILSDCSYYAEIINIDKHNILRNIFNMNKIFKNNA